MPCTRPADWRFLDGYPVNAEAPPVQIHNRCPNCRQSARLSASKAASCRRKWHVGCKRKRAKRIERPPMRRSDAPKPPPHSTESGCRESDPYCGRVGGAAPARLLCTFAAAVLAACGEPGALGD